MEYGTKIVRDGVLYEASVIDAVGGGEQLVEICVGGRYVGQGRWSAGAISGIDLPAAITDDLNRSLAEAAAMPTPDASTPGCWLVQSWAVTGYSRRWFGSEAAARAELLGIASREGVDLAGVPEDVTYLDCSLEGACASSWMRIAPGTYEVARYAADGHGPATAPPVVVGTLEEAREEVSRRRAARGLQPLSIERLRWLGWPDDGDLEAYHDFQIGHERADGCGGYTVRRAVG